MSVILTEPVLIELMRKITHITLLLIIAFCCAVTHPTRGEVITIICGLNPGMDSIVMTSTDLLCNLDTNGNAKVEVFGDGSVEPYTFTWSCGGCSGNGTDSIFNLGSGFYSVTVTPASGAPPTIQ